MSTKTYVLPNASPRTILSLMSTFFIIAMVVAMLSVLGVLVLGLFSMVKGGAFNEKYGNKLMQARVMLQGAALLFLFLAFVLSKSS